MSDLSPEASAGSGPLPAGSTPAVGDPVSSVDGGEHHRHGHADILDAPPTATVEALLRARLAELLGGWRGALETALPTVAFVVVWAVTHQVVAAVVASFVPVALFAVVRLAQKQTVRYALSSVFATAAAAFFALRSGQAEDAFLPGILWNIGMGSAAVVSVLVRWPLLGFMVAAADPSAAEDPKVYVQWRAHEGLVAVCQRLTLVLVVLFLGRVAIMLPMYLAAEVTLLGIAKIVLGWPAYLLAVAAMATMLVRGHTPLH